MIEFKKLLAGGDLRSIGKSNSVILKIHDQNDFDELFQCLFHPDRIVVMRAADAIEKITIIKPQYLNNHKKEVIEICKTTGNKELKWHLALLIPRLNLSKPEVSKGWNILSGWVRDKTNSRIVRVNSIQALFELAKLNMELDKKLKILFTELKKENIPSITARIKKIEKNSNN